MSPVSTATRRPGSKDARVRSSSMVLPEPGELIRFTHQVRSEEHTSELQSLRHLVCRLLLEKKRELHGFRARLHEVESAIVPSLGTLDGHGSTLVLLDAHRPESELHIFFNMQPTAYLFSLPLHDLLQF